jgi:endonuclease/exonuclease/phosphatase family metal-dependent hydrolase
LAAELPIAGGGPPLAVAVTHLSAFSYGDGTLVQQVDALAAWMAARPPDQPWILAGDLNLLPPGDDPKRLAVESELYADDPNPVERLLPRFQEAFADPLDPGVRTYLPFGAAEPDRKIDYVFYGGPIRLTGAEVLREHSQISDHLPIRVQFQLGGDLSNDAPATDAEATAPPVAVDAQPSADGGPPADGPPREPGP